MLTISFKCDICGSEETHELHQNFQTPKYDDYDFCRHCLYAMRLESAKRYKESYNSGVKF